MDLYQAGLTQVSALKHISTDVVSKKCGEFLTFGLRDIQLLHFILDFSMQDVLACVLQLLGHF